MSLTPARNNLCDVAFIFISYILTVPRLILGRERSQEGFLYRRTVPKDMFVIGEIADFYDKLRLQVLEKS
ncbi:MAG: hypothetical protein RMY29_020515 [Nostoc sp. CreGUA01]|nr:hypothetical protein [Nostoc sp. CreGUA01]